MAQKIKIFRMLCLLILPAAALVLGSCRNSAPAAGILTGNVAYGNGNYQRAILKYLRAEDGLQNGRDTVLYNLANVYYALGEGDAALQAWSQAEQETGDAELLFRIAFNRGVLYYQWGRYDEAYRSFRRALELEPSDLDTKINLEDSLSRIRSAAAQTPAALGISSGGNDEEGGRLLDYVKRKEAEAWTTQDAADSTYEQDW